MGTRCAKSPDFVRKTKNSECYFNFKNNAYIYNYVDHLGNTRLSYFAGNNGVEILEEINYYPFGLKHEGYNSITGNTAYNYKYNGKKLQETGMYDYGARMYMPDIGRWGVVDPLSEKGHIFSPYNYAYNNPIRFIDPDGRENQDWVNKGNTWSYDESITTVEQAQKTSGVSGFAENGTIIDTENGYARLEDKGNVNWLPTESIQDNITNFLAYSSPANSTTTWDPETFLQITNSSGGVGSARTDFDPSTHDKLYADDKIIPIDMGSILTPKNKSPFWAKNIFGLVKNGISISKLFGDSQNTDNNKIDTMTLQVKSLNESTIDNTSLFYHAAILPKQ